MSISQTKKKLTLEKALNLARQTQAPLWYRCRPMLWFDEGALRTLEPEFQKETWIFASYDPLASWSGALTSHLESFFQRYAGLNLTFGLMTPVSKGSNELPQALQEWISHSHYRHIFVGDIEGQIARALGAVDADLNLLVISEGKTALKWSSREGTFFDFENHFQQWLRRNDPGLPLIDPTHPSPNHPWPKLN